MVQTLCANLHCNYTLLKELSDIFSSVSIFSQSWYTSNIIMSQEHESLLPETDEEYLSTTNQVRNHFSKVVNILTNSEAIDTTITEEWPIALEFSGWASDDCIEFCNTHGLIDDLRRCRSALNELFSNIKKSTAELDYYPEINVDDEGHVVIRLEIESDRKTYRNDYNSCVSWMVDNLGDESRMFITLSIDRL